MSEVISPTELYNTMPNIRRCLDARHDLAMLGGGDGQKWYLTKETMEHLYIEIGEYPRRECHALFGITIFTARPGQGDELHGEKHQIIKF